MPGDQLPTAPVRLSPIAETRRREGMPEETALAWLVRRSVAQRLPRVSSSARPLYPILVVDGDKAVLNKSAILTNANFRVLSAVSGADALDLAEETDRKIDLLLSDVPMWTCPGTRHHLVTQRPVFWWVSRRRWATKARLRRKDSDPNQSVGPAIGYSRRHGGRHSAANCGPLCHRRTR